MIQFKTSDTPICSHKDLVVTISGNFSYCTFVKAGHIITIIPTKIAGSSINSRRGHKRWSFTDRRPSKLRSVESLLDVRRVDTYDDA